MLVKTRLGLGEGREVAYLDRASQSLHRPFTGARIDKAEKGRAVCTVDAYCASCEIIPMLESVRHQALKKAVRGDRSGPPPEHAARIVRILRELDIASLPKTWPCQVTGYTR